jgi:hypothetical protein
MQWSEERKIRDEMAEKWAEKQNSNLSNAIDVICEIQSISTRRRDFLLLVIAMGVAVHIAASSLLDIMLGSTSPILFAGILIGISVGLACYYVYNRMNPRPVLPPQLDTYMSHEELMGFIHDESGRIKKLMDEGEGIRNFQSFAKQFLTKLASCSDLMFGVAEVRREIAAGTGKLDPEYPPWHVTLDLPDFMLKPQRIRNTARFAIYPHIYEVAGQKSVRRLTVVFSIGILNPENPYADEFLRTFCELRLSRIPQIIALVLSNQFQSLMEGVRVR